MRCTLTKHRSLRLAACNVHLRYAKIALAVAHASRSFSSVRCACCLFLDVDCAERGQGRRWPSLARACPPPSTNVAMDPASRALVQTLPTGVPDTYASRSEHSNVPISTLVHRRNGRRSREEQARSQQYLSREEEKGLVRFLLLMANLGHPVRIKFIRSLAFSIARQRSTTTQPDKPPGKNWPKAFAERNPELQARKVKAMDWKRHENNVYDKIIEWFDVIGQVLKDPSVLPGNVYNMDETGVMLSMLGSVKVLVGKDDRRNYRGAGVKRTMVTAVECISADGRALLPLIIWPASTHRSNWTTYPTPGLRVFLTLRLKHKLTESHVC